MAGSSSDSGRTSHLMRAHTEIHLRYRGGGVEERRESQIGRGWSRLAGRVVHISRTSPLGAIARFDLGNLGVDFRRPLRCRGIRRAMVEHVMAACCAPWDVFALEGLPPLHCTPGEASELWRVERQQRPRERERGQESWNTFARRRQLAQSGRPSPRALARFDKSSGPRRTSIGGLYVGSIVSVLPCASC